MMTASIVLTATAVAIVVVAFAGGAVFSYLFLRANAQKKAKLDAEVNKVAQKL
jgi:threonine/homoserine/homoserine lactone efflux protein